MKNKFKIYMICFCFWNFSVQSVSVEAKTNNQQIQITKKLKAQGIVPGKVYFQHDFRFSIKSKYSFPEKDLFSSVVVLETKSRMYREGIQSIAKVKLNENYQYSDIWQRKRNIIDILYPTDSFQSLEDGVYFYTLDEHKQLHQQASFEEVFELPCYLRVEKNRAL
jgi:hypothetical protein